jgi:hypothetical protein
MKSALRGKNISAGEVSKVGSDGFWLLVDEREFFLPFKDFPWFQDATVREISAVERPAPKHLRWPNLDVDLSLESIEHPERFPLVAGQSGPRPASRARRRASRRT